MSPTSVASGDSPHITILGGGPAGLAVGYYARKSGLPFAIYEANERVGGNCVTLQKGEFRFDSGAHRLHDKDPEVTSEIKALLGDELRRIDVLSRIYHRGRFITFPLSPLNLLKNIGLASCFRAALELVRARTGANRRRLVSFEDHAVHAYGREIATRFLLNYSQKLWGLPCDRLSPSVSGKRISGLSIKTFLLEAVLGRRSKARHLDGAFYYPRHGYGTIVERLGETCGAENIHLNSRITRVFHSDGRIQAVEVGGAHRVATREVVSTLPISLLVELLDPAPPAEIRDLARRQRFRNVVLVALFVAKESITSSGSIYFPDADCPFTRIYEPRNRSPLMAPPGHTSLVAEIPCDATDAWWTSSDDDLVEMVTRHAVELDWLERDQVVGSATHRLPYAYPVLEVGSDADIARIVDHFGAFSNLKLVGRNGRFVYTHMHDMMRFGSDTIDELTSRPLEQRPMPGSDEEAVNDSARPSGTRT